MPLRRDIHALMHRPYNFSAGPAAMPLEVLQEAAAEMTDWHGSGMSVMEMSHRSAAFGSIYEQTHNDLRDLLSIPAHFKILFMQGGGLAENALVPMNLAARRKADVSTAQADFVITGSWSEKSLQEAGKYCATHVAASNQAEFFTTMPPPAGWAIRPGTSYVHVCGNETIHGVEFHELPDLRRLGSDAELVVDFSSHVATRAVDWSRIGVAFGGAQKNLGPAGLTLVVIREDLLGHAMACCPSAFDYSVVAKNGSMYNTPPTYAIYMAGLVFKWLKKQGGVSAMEAANRAKAQLLYEAIDASGLYENKVAPACRSRMNIPFFLRDPSFNDAFLKAAESRGLLQLKGHKSVGGMRASLYNAMPMAGVQALVAFMRDFERGTVV